jgi:hypothetical protein
MRESVKIIFAIEYVKSYDFEEYVELLYLQNIRRTNWMDYYYFSLGTASLPVPLNEKTVLINYDGLAYARGKHSPYITVSTNNDGFVIKRAETIDPKSPDPFWIKVERVEPYEFGNLREFILQKIKEVEEAKRKHEKGKV